MRFNCFVVLALVFSSSLSASELVEAAWEADLEKVKALVKAKPTAVNEYWDAVESTPLMAAIKGLKNSAREKEIPIRLAIVKYLIEQKSDVKLRDKRFQTTALHDAAQREMKEVAQALLDAGAEINATDKFGNTPLLIAVGTRTPDVTELLLARNSDINAENKHGWTALTLATQHPWARAKTVELLLNKKMDPNKPGGPNKLTPMQLATKEFWGETADIVKLLLDAGANPQITNAEGKVITVSATPLLNKQALMQAVWDADFPKLKASIEEDASLLDFKFSNDSPLICAVLDGLMPPRDMKEEAKLDARKAFGLQSLKYLLEKKVDPNRADKNRFTALHFAAGAGILQGVELLVNAGANINAIANKDGGLTPISLAVFSEHKDVVEYLLTKKADTSIQGYSLLTLAAGYGKTEMVRLLLSKKLNPNETGGPKKQTPLHLAAQKTHSNPDKAKSDEVIKVLLAGGADPKIKDADGRTYMDYYKARDNEGELPPIVVGKWYPKMDTRTFHLPLQLKGNISKAEDDKLVAAFSALLASETYEFSEDGSFKYELNVPKSLLPQLLEVAALGETPAVQAGMKKEFTDMCANSPKIARGKWSASGTVVTFDFSPRPELKIEGKVTLKDERLYISGGFRSGCWLEAKK